MSENLNLFPILKFSTLVIYFYINQCNGFYVSTYLHMNKLSQCTPIILSIYKHHRLPLDAV